MGSSNYRSASGHEDPFVEVSRTGWVRTDDGYALAEDESVRVVLQGTEILGFVGAKLASSYATTGLSSDKIEAMMAELEQPVFEQ